LVVAAGDRLGDGDCTGDLVKDLRAMAAKTRGQSGEARRGRSTKSKAKRDDGAERDTLSEVYRTRLAKLVTDPKMLEDYRTATGEDVGDGFFPTWAEYIAAKVAYRAAKNETGTRDAKELREASEGLLDEEADKPTYVLGMSGLPRTNAVTGAAREETDENEGWGA
jgi:hypothetical protein